MADDSQVAVILNGKNITLSDIDHELDRPEIKAILDSSQNDPKIKTQLRANALRSLIDRTLMLEAATHSNAAPQETITKELQAFVNGHGGKEKLEKIIIQNGGTYARFEEEMRQSLILRAYIEKELTKDVVIDEKELHAIYEGSPATYVNPEEVHARHILIATGKGVSDNDALKKAQDVYNRILKGEDFSKLAGNYSDDPGSKVTGGDLGFFPKGVMVPEFEKTAFTLKPGEVGAPLKTQFGFHIIKVEEKRAQKQLSFEEAKERIKAELLAKKRSDIVTKKLTELRENAKVEYKIPELNQALTK